MKRLLLCCVLSISVWQACAQQQALVYRTIADSLYAYSNYPDAAQYYEHALKHAPDSSDVMLCLGRTYAKYNNVALSEVWYRQAAARQAAFEPEDTYLYINVLLGQGKRQEAEDVLQMFLKQMPDAPYVSFLWKDVHNQEQYYADSTFYTVTPLSALNTPEAEFAPVFYKNGLLFTASRKNSVLAKKYHWDHAGFLGLYYAAFDEAHQLSKAQPFDKGLKTQLHQGPASVYAGNTRMIVNCNAAGQVDETSGVTFSRSTLVDAVQDPDTKKWRISPLPFVDSKYSFVHPHISEDGTVLYFASNKPGGFGGMDLYVVTRVGGTWGKPVNLGENINTADDDVFPYFFDHTLYFASNGRGGLGGLDLFKSIGELSTFCTPRNLGYPINSQLDDFSLVTDDHTQGYFASARNGNDDLFEYTQVRKTMRLMAHMRDSLTRVSIPAAEISIQSETGTFTVVADAHGYVTYELPDESFYVLTADYQGKMGMLIGMVNTTEDSDHKVHEVALYQEEPDAVACVGLVKDVLGQLQDVADVLVIDQATGEVVKSTIANSSIQFNGKRNRQYRIEVVTKQGDVVKETLSVAPEDAKVKTWTMEAEHDLSKVTLLVQVLHQTGRQAVADAHVIVSTLDDAGQELISNAQGEVTATVAGGAAYMVVASTETASGMQYGFAHSTEGDDVMRDTVWLREGETPPVQGMVQVKNAQGQNLTESMVTIINDRTGETVVQKADHGLLPFNPDANQSYTIRVEQKGYQPIEKKVITTSRAVENFSFILAEEAPLPPMITARVVMAADSTPVEQAVIQVTSAAVDELELLTDARGRVDIPLAAGAPYILFASKGEYVGMHSGMMPAGGSHPVEEHTVALQKTAYDSSRVYGLVTNQNGESLPQANVEVMNVRTGERIPGAMDNGMVSFPADKGGEYRVVVSAENYVTEDKIIRLDSGTSVTSLEPFRLRKQLPLTLNIEDEKGVPLADALVTLKDEQTGQAIPVQTQNGSLTFPGVQGKTYSITVSHDRYKSVQEKIIIPIQANSAGERYIMLTSEITTHVTYTLKARVLMERDSFPVAQATVKLLSTDLDEKEFVTGQDGVVNLDLPEGSPYILFANKGDYVGMYSGMFTPDTEDASVVHPVVLHTAEVAPDSSFVYGFVTDLDGSLLTDAAVEVMDTETNERLTANVTDGVLSFSGKKGAQYKVVVSGDPYETVAQTVTLNTADQYTSLEPIKLRKRELAEPLSIDAETVKNNVIGARVLTATDSLPVQGARVRVTSLELDNDLELVTDDAGAIDFTLPDGAPYLLFVDKAEAVGMLNSVSTPTDERTAGGHPVVLHDTQAAQDSAFAFGFVTDDQGAVKSATMVEVTDEASGEKIPARITEGVLSFSGKKGRAYHITIAGENYDTTEQTVTLPAGEVYTKLPAITLTAHVPSQGDTTAPAPTIAPEPVAAVPEEATEATTAPEKLKSYVISTRVLMGPDGKPVADAIVKVASFAFEEDLEMVTGADGVISFTLPEGAPYIVFVNKGDQVGMFTGISEPNASLPALPLHASALTKVAQDASDSSSPIISHPIVAQVVKGADSVAVPGARAKVTSFVMDDMDIVTGQDGLVRFSLPEGSPYMVFVNKNGYNGMLSGTTQDDGNTAVNLRAIALIKPPKNKVMMLTTLSDENNAPLMTGDVIVTDMSTGEQITTTVENGFLAFYGKKGVDYQLTVKAPGYESATETLSIAATETELASRHITLRSLEKPMLQEALWVRDGIDSTHVENAPVKIISFEQDDLLLTADSAGQVQFSLSEAAPYMAVVAVGKRHGIYAGVTGDDTQDHIVMLYEQLDHQVPVLGMLADTKGRPVTTAQVTVTNMTTGESHVAQVTNGMVSFKGDKGTQYTITVTSDEYETQEEHLTIDTGADGTHEISISFTLRKLMVLPATSTLLVVQNETPHVYILSSDVQEEIIEENGMLYLKNQDSKRLVGKGTMATLLKDPTRWLEMADHQMLTLENIYFDFNSTALDEEAQATLKKANALMAQYPHLFLTVSAHADTRGGKSYNLQLTHKRARAVRNYLTGNGLKTNRIETKAYGKSSPAVVCATPECTEAQHKRNRRAEFILGSMPKIMLDSVPIVKTTPTVMAPTATVRVHNKYSDILARYGDRELEGLVFKVCIGAYRLNDSLTFQELDDLGTIEQALNNGIHFYYLKPFHSMNAAEAVRQQVIQRGITDAYIEIFYQGRKISFSRFMDITE